MIQKPFIFCQKNVYAVMLAAKNIFCILDALERFHPSIISFLQSQKVHFGTTQSQINLKKIFQFLYLLGRKLKITAFTAFSLKLQIYKSLFFIVHIGYLLWNKWRFSRVNKIDMGFTMTEDFLRRWKKCKTIPAQDWQWLHTLYSGSHKPSINYAV